MSLADKVQRSVVAGSSQRRTELSEPTVLLFGDSHAYAYQRAIEKRLGKGRATPLTAHRLLKTKGTKNIGDTSFEDFLRIVRPLGPEDLVFSVIGGNQHAVFGMVQHPEAFDFFEPGGIFRPEPPAAIVPYRALERVFAKGIRNGDGKSLESLKKATKARVIHIIPPPPKKDNRFIQQFHEAHFAREGITSLGVSSPGLRLKFWLLQKRQLEKLCGELGIEDMPPPLIALDEKGFLASDFYAEDATHANYQYGELVLREIERGYLGKEVAESAS
jgi:hypothetical protein